jgi:hypothetical protein
MRSAFAGIVDGTVSIVTWLHLAVVCSVPCLAPLLYSLKEGRLRKLHLSGVYFRGLDLGQAEYHTGPSFIASVIHRLFWSEIYVSLQEGW